MLIASAVCDQVLIRNPMSFGKIPLYVGKRWVLTKVVRILAVRHQLLLSQNRVIKCATVICLIAKPACSSQVVLRLCAASCIASVRRLPLVGSPDP